MLLAIETRRSHSRLQQHEAELKNGWGRTSVSVRLHGARRASDESDVDLFFDHEKGKLGLFEAYGREGAQRQHSSATRPIS